MNSLSKFLKKPAVTTVFALAACLYVLQSTSTRFVSDMREGRDELVASLRQAQTPEPQIAAISACVDRIKSDVDLMTTTFFSFTSVILIVFFATKQREQRRDEEPEVKGELRHDHAA